jgi:hypothetical protein
MRFSLSTPVSFVVLAACAAATGCSAGNPLEASCDRQATCAEDNDWQFSRSACQQEASFAFEKAKTAGCQDPLQAYADCTGELALSCDDDADAVAAKKCKSEAEDLAECMQDAADDEAKDKSKSTTGSGSSSGGSSSGGSSSGGLAAYCDKMAECSHGALTADQCANQQNAATSAATTAGCGDEFEALFACASELECTDLASYTTRCKSEYDAYTSACGH